MGTPAQGAQTKLAMDAVLPFDGSSEAFEFTSENLRMVQGHFYNAGIRGTRSRSKERVRISTEAVTGSISMHPSPAELDKLLPRILGAAESTDVFALAEALPEFQVMIDRITKVHTYTGCRVGRATFSGSQGGPVTLVLDIEGETEEVSVAGGFPAISVDFDTAYIFSDGVLTLQAGARPFNTFTLVIDNVLDADRYMNAVTRAEIPPQDRIVTLDVTCPYTTDEVALYDQAVAGAAGSLVFTNGGQSLGFAFANLKAPAESPVISGKTELLLPLRMTAYKSGSTAELIVTSDSAA